MWPILGVLLVGTLITLYEVPSLIKKKLMKELIVFLILLITGVILSILLSLEIKIPNPYDLIAFIFNPISHFLEWILK
ncbi:MAG: hypothetical protein ACQEWV_10160 [Bacillota bacterium]